MKCVAVAAVAAMIVATIMIADISARIAADGQKVTLTGRLTGTEDAATTGVFVLDADNLGAITINVGEVSYLGDYLAGAVGRRVVVTIEPEH